MYLNTVILQQQKIIYKDQHNCGHLSYNNLLQDHIKISKRVNKKRKKQRGNKTNNIILSFRVSGEMMT